MQGALLDEVGKKSLDQVLGVLGAVSPPSGKAVEGLPVSCAQLGQGLGASRRAALGRFEHETPARQLKVCPGGRDRSVMQFIMANMKIPPLFAFYKREAARKKPNRHNSETFAPRPVCKSP